MRGAVSRRLTERCCRTEGLPQGIGVCRGRSTGQLFHTESGEPAMRAPTAGGPDGGRWEPAAANEKAGVRLHTCFKFRPACDKTAHPPSNAHSTRYPNSQLRHGALAAHEAIRLMLLGSPPDMVHGTSLRETESSTPLIGVRRHSVHPPSGVHPRCSGLRVTGHRYLPD